MASPAQNNQMNPPGAQIRPQGQQQTPMGGTQQGKGPSSSGQPTYQPIGVNNPPASSSPVAPVPNGQSPFGMNAIADSNRMQNENTRDIDNYSPMLPPNALAQGAPKQWYPGMYPITSQQFGTNPYAPQTSNVQGHPGHNPSAVAAVEPNMGNSALSNQGQFQQVRTMADGGNAAFNNAPRMWNGPANPTAQANAAAPDVLSYMSKGPNNPVLNRPPQNGAKGPSSANGKGPGSLFSQIVAQNPDFANAMAMNQQPEVAPPPAPVPQPNQVYRPQYAQYANPGLPNLRS